MSVYTAYVCKFMYVCVCNFRKVSPAMTKIKSYVIEMKQTLNIAQKLSYVWKGAEIRFKPNVASVCDMFLNMHTFNKKK